jgi:hypothetical protein
MTPERLRPAVEASSKSSGSPLTGKAAIPANKRDDEFDVGEELSGFGLQGVKVSQDDLAALVEDLGLGGDDAEELIKGLSDSAPLEKKGLRIEKSDGGVKSGEAQLAKVLTDAIPKKKGLRIEKVVSEDDAAEPSSPTEKGQKEIKSAELEADSSPKAQESAH